MVSELINFYLFQVRQMGRDLGLADEFVQRHPFPGPGLAIRVICAEECYLERDFSETQVILKVIVDYASSVVKVSNVRLFNIFNSERNFQFW